MELVTDRRRRHVDPDPERVRRACVAATDYRSAKLRMAKVLVELEAGGDHLLRGYSSVRDFAVQELRLPGVDVPMLLDLGRSLSMPAAVDAVDGCGDERGDEPSAPPESDASTRDVFGQPDLGESASSDDVPAPPPAKPTVEDRVNDGALTIENAAQLSRLWRALGEVTDEVRRRWMRAAESTSPYRFRQMVRQAVEDAAQAEPTVHLPLQVTESARDEFRRAKELASRRARRLLTDGQVFAVIVRSYVASEDQRLVGEKKRRVGATKLLPGKRYVPATVVRAIRERADDRCEVPGCSNGGLLELMHVGKRHADGAGREVRDQALGCSTHHVLLDAGVIRFAGWRDDGKPRFRTLDGRLMGRQVTRNSGTGRSMTDLVTGGVSHARVRENERCGKTAAPRATQRARAPP